MNALIGFLRSFNWSTPSWDLFILFIFFIGSIVYGISLGRDRVVVVLMSIYTALAVSTNAPILSLLGSRVGYAQQPTGRVVLFFIIFLLVFFLTSHSPLLRGLRTMDGSRSLWQSFVFGFLEVGLLVSIVLTFLPAESTQGLTSLTKEVFMSDRGRTAWLIAPVILFGVLSFRRQEHSDGI